MTAAQDRWLELAQVEAFALVSLEVARSGGHDPGPHERALADARSDMATLADAGVDEPDGVAASVTAAVGSLRDTYLAHAEAAEERLALPDDVRRVLGVDDDAENRRLAVARSWLDAIDAAGVL